jgi:hypothetical protein
MGWDGITHASPQTSVVSEKIDVTTLVRALLPSFGREESMSTKIVASAVIALAVVACGASPETEEADEESDMTSSALSPRDDLPAPIHPRMPSLERPIWDLTPYVEELQQYRRLDNGRCTLRYVTIFDPGRGREIKVPITECY